MYPIAPGDALAVSNVAILFNGDHEQLTSPSAVGVVSVAARATAHSDADCFSHAVISWRAALAGAFTLEAEVLVVSTLDTGVTHNEQDMTAAALAVALATCKGGSLLKHIVVVLNNSEMHMRSSLGKALKIFGVTDRCTNVEGMGLSSVRSRNTHPTLRDMLFMAGLAESPCPVAGDGACCLYAANVWTGTTAPVVFGIHGIQSPVRGMRQDQRDAVDAMLRLREETTTWLVTDACQSISDDEPGLLRNDEAYSMQWRNYVTWRLGSYNLRDNEWSLASAAAGLPYTGIDKDARWEPGPARVLVELIIAAAGDPPRYVAEIDGTLIPDAKARFDAWHALQPRDALSQSQAAEAIKTLQSWLADPSPSLNMEWCSRLQALGRHLNNVNTDIVTKIATSADNNKLVFTGCTHALALALATQPALGTYAAKMRDDFLSLPVLHGAQLGARFNKYAVYDFKGLCGSSPGGLWADEVHVKGIAEVLQTQIVVILRPVGSGDHDIPDSVRVYTPGERVVYKLKSWDSDVAPRVLAQQCGAQISPPIMVLTFVNGNHFEPAQQSANMSVAFKRAYELHCTALREAQQTTAAQRRPHLGDSEQASNASLAKRARF